MPIIEYKNLANNLYWLVKSGIATDCDFYGEPHEISKVFDWLRKQGKELPNHADFTKQAKEAMARQTARVTERMDKEQKDQLRLFLFDSQPIDPAQVEEWAKCAALWDYLKQIANNG